MTHIIGESAGSVLLKAGEVGKASRLAMLRAYAGEIPYVPDDLEAVRAALLSAFGGDFRTALALGTPARNTQQAQSAYGQAIHAMILAREGHMRESRVLGAAASERFILQDDYAYAAALWRSLAWFEYTCGEFSACESMLNRAMGICIEADLPQWYRIIALPAAHVAQTRGDISTCLRLLRTCMKRASPACDVIQRTAAIALGVAARDSQLLAPYASMRSVEHALVVGQFHEAYMMITNLAAAVRGALIDVDLESLMRLAIRSLADPLEAMEVLVDVTAHGTAADATEAAALLESLPRSDHQRLAIACVHLGRVYAQLHMQSDERAAQYAAEAARRFKAIGAASYLTRTMDVLVQGAKSTRKRADRYRRLTDRQLQVLAMLRAGHPNKDIARTLGIGEHTVERHVSVILNELNVRSRWQLVD